MTIKSSLLKYAAGAFVALTMAVPAAWAESELVIYSAYPSDQLKPIKDAFEAANPDITVRQLEQPGEELIATLELEMRAGSPKADVIGLNEASMNYLKTKHDAFEPYAAKDIAAVMPSFQKDGNFITPLFVTLYTIHYNTNKISKDDAPKSWADLLDPKWTDQIAIADPSHSQSIHSFMWFIANHLGDKDSENYGWQYFEKLGKLNPRLESSHGTIRDLVISGERPIGVQVLVHAQSTARRGEPTDSVWPKEGTPGELVAFGLVRNAPHADAGRKWLDFLVSAEAQALVPDALGGAPVRSDTSYVLPDGTPLNEITVVPVDATFVSDNKKSQTDKYHAAMGK